MPRKKYRYVDQAGVEQFTYSDTDLTKTAGGDKFTFVPEKPKENKYSTFSLPKVGEDGWKPEYTPGTGAPVTGGNSFTQQPPHTVDDNPNSFKINKPNFLSSLPNNERTLNDEQLKAQVEQLKADSQAEIDKIKQKGKMMLGGTKSFLSKIGALGKTITGAPVETNLGILSTQQEQIDKAIKEQEALLQRKITGAKADNDKAVKERIKALNDIMQQNFENSIKLVEEDRKLDDQTRKDTLADLQVQKFNFEIQKANNDLTRENIKDTLTSIDRMAESGLPLTELSVSLINDLETEANLPSGTFEAYYQAKQDAKQMETQENLLKVKKMEQDILNSIEKIEIARMQADTAKRRAGIAAFSAQTSADRLAFEKDKYADKQGDNGGLTDDQEKARKKAIADLADNGSWSKNYNTMLGQYPELGRAITDEERQQYDIPPEYETLLDYLLDKGKYYKQTGKKKNTGNNSERELPGS